EAADVEAVAECRLRAGSQLEDLQHADLVRRRLARQDDVAPDLRADLALCRRRVRDEVLDGLRLGPASRVQARIDDEADRAPELAAEPAEVGVGILVTAHLFREPLAYN